MRKYRFYDLKFIVFSSYLRWTVLVISKVSYKFDIESFDQNEMVLKLSYKYDIEKEEKSLSQENCLKSLTALY